MMHSAQIVNTYVEAGRDLRFGHAAGRVLNTRLYRSNGSVLDLRSVICIERALNHRSEPEVRWLLRTLFMLMEDRGAQGISLDRMRLLFEAFAQECAATDFDFERIFAQADKLGGIW